MRGSDSRLIVCSVAQRNCCLRRNATTRGGEEFGVTGTTVYDRSMVLQRIILAVALILAFTLGSSGYASHDSAGPKTMASMAAANAAMPDAPMPMQGKCSPGGKTHPALSACSAICAGTALPFPDAVQFSLSVSGALYHHLPVRQVSGSVISPDPYPPKPIVLA
jgi:hypothetical protein